METGSEWPILDLQDPTSRGRFLFGVKNLSILFSSTGSPTMVPIQTNILYIIVSHSTIVSY